jgi:PPM family protein phosphatase
MVTFHGATDVGRRRTVNEEAVFAHDGLFVVCDGMGGHEAGEVASAIATDVIATFIQRSGADHEITWPYGFDRRMSLDENRLRTAIKLANRAVFRKAASASVYSGMGATVAAALIPRGRQPMIYAVVGDSHIYLLRSGAIVRLSRDDTCPDASRKGEPPDDSALASMKHVLTKAPGAADDVDFAVSRQELIDGDMVLLCSDGLTNMLADARILDVVSTRVPDLEAACHDLIAAASAEGGRDNVSAVLVRYAA